MLARAPVMEYINLLKSRGGLQSSLDQEQRLQALFFSEGITFGGSTFNRTPQPHRFS